MLHLPNLDGFIMLEITLLDVVGYINASMLKHGNYDNKTLVLLYYAWGFPLQVIIVILTLITLIPFTILSPHHTHVIPNFMPIVMTSLFHLVK